MRITVKTKYSDLQTVEKYLNRKSVAELKKAAAAEYGEMYDLTFAQFHACSNGDFGEILGDLKDPTVLQYFWVKAFGDFVDDFAKQLKRMTIAQTPEEQRAAAGLLETNWAEGMLVFIRNYFGLPSFKAAEQITMGEILIAKRAQYNSDLFQRNMSKIQLEKYKKR